jgi:hypothetical protein
MSYPLGLTYESCRQRYRVRLYYRQKVVWRSYHPTLHEARQALMQAHEHRQHHAADTAAFVPKPRPHMALDLLT